MKIIITINCDNAAFTEDPSVEVARILQKYAARLRESYPPLEDLEGDTLRDINGNTVGAVQVVDGETRAVDVVHFNDNGEVLCGTEVWLRRTEDRAAVTCKDCKGAMEDGPQE
jgi:hypothetical protein